MCPDRPGLPEERDRPDRPLVEPTCPFTVDRPYFWAAMTFAEAGGPPGEERGPAGEIRGPAGEGSQIRYECQRRRPGARGTSSRVRVRIGRPERDR